MSDSFDMFEDDPSDSTASKAVEKPKEKQQEIKPAPLPENPVEIDLANVAPEKRERLLSQARTLGWTVKNEHLVEELKSNKGPKQAMLLEFPENPPSEVKEMTPLFRMTRQRDLDILFCGLQIGPIFQDKVEVAVKSKFLDRSDPKRIVSEHFVVFIYLAIALPFGENDSMMSGWGLTFFCPREFERIIPKALRVHLGIDIWWEQTGNRFDTIYYRVAKVANEQEKEKAIEEAKLIAKLAWALVTLGAPKPEIPASAIERWIVEYYEKHPEERKLLNLDSEKEKNTPTTDAKAGESSASTKVSAPVKSGEIIRMPEPAENSPVDSTHPLAVAAYEREQKNAKPAPEKPASIF